MFILISLIQLLNYQIGFLYYVLIIVTKSFNFFLFLHFFVMFKEQHNLKSFLLYNYLCYFMILKSFLNILVQLLFFLLFFLMIFQRFIFKIQVSTVLFFCVITFIFFLFIFIFFLIIYLFDFVIFLEFLLVPMQSILFILPLKVVFLFPDLINFQIN